MIESSRPLSIEELCEALHIQSPLIVEMVEYELIEPEGQSPEDWRFDSLCLKRARIAANFYRDLEVNLSGISLALDLLDKIELMQSRIDTLEKLIKD